MQLRDVRALVWPVHLSERQRMRTVVYLAVMGFASSLSIWLAALDSAGLPWVDASRNVLFLALAFGLGFASYGISAWWLMVLGLHHRRSAYLLLAMSLVMNTILLDAAVNRPTDYQNMAAGILAALIIAVVTTQRDAPALGKREAE